MFQIGNERVALVTDTSCDLSDEQLSQYDIRTVALRVATSQGEFRDRLEITQEQLYDLLQREVPKTSLPLPEDVSTPVKAWPVMFFFQQNDLSGSDVVQCVTVCHPGMLPVVQLIPADKPGVALWQIPLLNDAVRPCSICEVSCRRIRVNNVRNVLKVDVVQ